MTRRKKLKISFPLPFNHHSPPPGQTPIIIKMCSTHMKMNYKKWIVKRNKLYKKDWTGPRSKTDSPFPKPDGIPDPKDQGPKDNDTATAK